MDRTNMVGRCMGRAQGADHHPRMAPGQAPEDPSSIIKQPSIMKQPTCCRMYCCVPSVAILGTIASLPMQADAAELQAGCSLHLRRHAEDMRIIQVFQTTHTLDRNKCLSREGEGRGGGGGVVTVGTGRAAYGQPCLRVFRDPTGNRGKWGGGGGEDGHRESLTCQPCLRASRDPTGNRLPDWLWAVWNGPTRPGHQLLLVLLHEGGIGSQ